MQFLACFPFNNGVIEDSDGEFSVGSCLTAAYGYAFPHLAVGKQRFISLGIGADAG